MERRCKWCGHGDRLDRGTVHIYGSQADNTYHSGCWQAHKDCEERKQKRYNRTQANRKD